MILRLVLLIVLVGLGPAAATRAQTPSGVAARLQVLDAALGLTAPQKRAVQTLLVEQNAFYVEWAAARLTPKRGSDTGARTGRKVREKAQFDAALRRLLTPEQIARYERLRSAEQVEDLRVMHGGSSHP